MLKSLPKILTIFFLLIFIFQLTCLIFLFTLPIAGQASKIEFSPQVQGLDYTFNSSDKTTRNIANYVGAIYKYAIGIVGILAAVVLMIGGVMWIIAGGNATAIGEAKAWIGASLTGLVLALMSYLILATVNPNLVNFKIRAITSVKDMGTATTTITGFTDQTSPELTSFISCMQSHNITGFTITSTTDTHIAQGTCNPTDPNESFNNPSRCQHAQYSCHYGGSNCALKGSYAIDVDDSADGKKVAEAAAGCGSQLGNYTSARCILNEGGTHHHISIGAYNNCGCDTSLATCESQK